MKTLPSKIIQAPMLGAQDSKMTIAACNNGLIGSLACSSLSPEELAREIETIQKATDKPFNLNFFAHQMPEITAKQITAQNEFLSPYFKEFNINPDNIPEGVIRRPFGEKQAEIVEKYRPQIVSFHFGLPENNLLAAVKNTGAVVISSATTLQEAVFLEENGADFIIAQGLEAGGHRGNFLSKIEEQIGLFALLNSMRKIIKKPIIAAGGIADKASIQAAFMLGADYVQIGTAFLLCTESKISLIHRREIKKNIADKANFSTALTNLFSGKPARGIINRFMRENNFISEKILPFPYAASANNAIKKEAEKLDKEDFSSLWCGQNPFNCQEISTAEMAKLLLSYL
ncbi:MAG: nitronate monooxygenase [Cardiobacteriaceae bacterium]|nr:nitronate monooxygenase [Cardiobacteriaceae bacterium]